MVHTQASEIKKSSHPTEPRLSQKRVNVLIKKRIVDNPVKGHVASDVRYARWCISSIEGILLFFFL